MWGNRPSDIFCSQRSATEASSSKQHETLWSRLSPSPISRACFGLELFGVGLSPLVGLLPRPTLQGDTISPKLFTATLESIFRRLNLENKGVKIDGEFLSHLRFADDIFLCTETPQELQQMLQELSDESRRMGLKMNITKTKVMVVDNTPINVNNVLIENVQGYDVYLGQHYSLKEKNQDKEIQRRIMAGWAAYAKHRDIFKSNLAICLKRQVYNSCVLLAMTYVPETWTLTKQAQNKLAAAQTKMERSMLNITYKDRKTNIWVRERTKVIDIINTVRKMKWSWAGHINRLKDDDGPRVSPLGDRMTRKDDKGDQPSGGETT